jgi:multidrug efflux pump subunit AcrB
MLMAALLVFGGLGFQNLGVSQMPDVDFPQVTVRLTREGASPQTMETDVVEIVEDACMAVEGIVDISSTSQQGLATVTLEFDVGRDIDAALQETQTKIAQAQRRLPEALDPPVITKSNPRTSPSSGSACRGRCRPRSWPTSRASRCASASRPSTGWARSSSAATASGASACGSTRRGWTRAA